jgi:hypothetical protein
MKTLVAGAGASAATDQPAGISITGFGAFSAATGEKVVDAIVDIAQKLDENDIPDDGDRFAVLPPELYYLLISDASGNIALNKDYGGVGSIAQGNVPMVAGDIAVVDGSQIQDDDSAKNNPFDDASGGTDANGYNADLSTLRFIGGHKSCVGTVKLLDLATDMDYSVQRQGTLLVAKYAMGHNFLRQGACVKVVN